MSKKNKKKSNSKKIVVILLEYILTIICLLLIFLLLKENIDSNTILDEDGIRWSYSIENGQAINVCYYSGKLGEVVKIPELINGYQVIGIKGNNSSQNIFNSYQNRIVKQIIIPDSVQNIGESCFKNCTSLEKIELPDNLITMGASAFEGCTNLKNIRIGDKVTIIEKETFQNCYSLENINLPNGLESIGYNAFSNCSKLKEINLPNGLTSLGECAFSYCKNLKEISIPKNIQRIGYNTFISCENLTKVNINNGLLSIGNDAFNGCYSIKEINLPNSITSIGMESFMNCASLQNVILPQNIIAIEKACFANCSSLQNITIGENIEKIEVQAFAGCESLKYINIPARVKDIGTYAFYGCNKLETIKIDRNNPNYIIQDGVLYNKDKTELISIINNRQSQFTVPDTVVTIKQGAFRGNEFFKTIYLNENIKRIENFAFADCTQLTDIYLENKKENVEFINGWNLNTYAYLHDINCVHEVEQISQNGMPQNSIITKVKCGGNHTFKVAGKVQNMKVRVISEGDFANSNKTSEIIYSDKDGIYSIENINRNKKILLQSKNESGGVYIRYTDARGNDIEESNYIEGVIGEEYYTKPKNISGYARIKDTSIIENGTFSDNLITVTYSYQKIDRNTINLFERQDIMIYIIIVLTTILVNLIIYIIMDKKRK